MTVNAASQFGTVVAGGEGRWLNGEAGVESGRRIGSMALRGGLSAFGLHYMDPFAYDAAGVRLRSALSRPAGDFVVSLRPVASIGGWRTELLEGPLRLAGGDAELSGDLGPVRGSVSAGALAVANGVTSGAFLRTNAQALYGWRGWYGALRLEVQRSPLETELGGGLTLAGTVRPGVQVRVVAARNVRDPLFGTEGTMALSAGVSVRPLRWVPPSPPPVAAVGERTEEGRVVRFAIRAEGAGQVQITGDFTGWEPVGMERTSRGWEWRTVLPSGVHHFGFLVDGEWAIPEDAPGVVADGWGRENASIVVEP